MRVLFSAPDAFIDALWMLAERDLDMSLVETSGMQGFVSLSDDSMVLVDGVTGDIQLKSIPAGIKPPGVTFIYPNTKPLKHLLKKAYEKVFHESHLIFS